MNSNLRQYVLGKRKKATTSFSISMFGERGNCPEYFKISSKPRRKTLPVRAKMTLHIHMRTNTGRLAPGHFKKVFSAVLTKQRQPVTLALAPETS